MKKIICALVLGLLVSASGYARDSMRFRTHLEGFDVAGAPVATNATGEAKVEVIDEGTALKFRVNVAGIENLWMAHIHVASGPVEVTDRAGPVAFWFTGGPPPDTTLAERVNGRLAEGYIITNGQLVSWDTADPLDGTVDGLIMAIEEGRASVIVHTNDQDPDTPTGVQGDSPPGELRGTLR